MLFARDGTDWQHFYLGTIGTGVRSQSILLADGGTSLQHAAV